MLSNNTGHHRDRQELLQDTIQAKLDKIKKDFDRSQRDIVSHSQGGAGLAAGLGEGEAAALAAVRDQFSNSLLSPSSQNPQFIGSLELTHADATAGSLHGDQDKTIGSVLGGSRKKQTLASMLQRSPISSHQGYLSRLESQNLEEDHISLVLDANKVPNVGRIGATGMTPNDTSKKEKAFSPNVSQLQLADKYRGVIRGVGQQSSVFGASGAGTKASHRVFGVQQQLYKDVDSDHQQKMLHSNIYIPDYESESKYDETNFSDQRRGDAGANRVL